MGKNKRKILLNGLIILSFMLLIGCNKKEVRNNEIKSGNLIKKFSLKQFSNKINLFIDGEAGEIQSENIKVKKPSLLIDRKIEVIEIKTGKEGKAEIEINPENKQIESVIFTGNVKIIQKDKRTKEIIMEAECGKLTYSNKKKEMIMENSPVIRRGKNVFSGEKIYYYLEKNTLQIKGNVNVKIIPEK
ncbi:LPS export ABC transporter periplasmic protein LptC [bacterium]|nr:LPS export ABC transporter periplasmic protein LptC [bacterium]